MSHTMVTVWASLFRPTEGRRVPFDALARRVADPRSYSTKEAVPRWSGALFREDARALANVQRVAVLAYDFDEGATREQLEHVFGDLTGFAHTTWRSTPETKRWRVALLLDRPVTREEFDRVWRAGAAHAERHGLAPDYSARDASRAWALPAMRPGYEHLAFAGALFDVGAALTEFPPPPPDTAARPATDDRSESYAHRRTRARRYLEKMSGGISGSGGHATTFKAALVLVRGFALEPDDALALLIEVHNPTCQPPWSTRDLRHKVRQALQRGRAEHGWLASRPRSVGGAP